MEWCQTFLSEEVKSENAGETFGELLSFISITVKSISPIQQNSMKNGYDENKT